MMFCEHDNIFPSFFFKINGVMCKKHKLSDTDALVSALRQKETLSIITKDITEIIRLCEKNGKPVPTEFRLVYTVTTGNLKADYSYDSVASEEKTIQDVSEEWFVQQSK